MTLMEAARAAADVLLNDAVITVRERVSVNGRSDAGLIDREQRATHGLAWFATYAEAIRQLGSYTERMSRNGRLGETEELLVRIGAGEFLAQMAGGIPMSQGELVRPADLGLDARAVAARLSPAVDELIATGNTAENRARLIALMADRHGATVGDCGLDDILNSMREEMRRFADTEVISNAQQWHRSNSYIPLEVIGKMAELGVFGLTIPEEFGGLGLGKESMCVVSEELSRYIGVGRWDT
jgi:(2S)-methylsuccinyl-CoA dehydrogenase